MAMATIAARPTRASKFLAARDATNSRTRRASRTTTRKREASPPEGSTRNHGAVSTTTTRSNTPRGVLRYLWLYDRRQDEGDLDVAVEPLQDRRGLGRARLAQCQLLRHRPRGHPPIVVEGPGPSG